MYVIKKETRNFGLVEIDLPKCSGVLRMLSVGFFSQPALNNDLQTSALLFLAAQCNGVQPASSFAFKFSNSYLTSILVAGLSCTSFFTVAI